MDSDLDGLIARARVANSESARLERLASEIAIEAAVTCARHQLLPLSPTVEARLHVDRGDVERGPLATARDAEHEPSELYDQLTDWHSTGPRSPA